MDARTLADAIKTAVTAREAATRYGCAPNRQGFICCPFHFEKTPSLLLRNDARGFVCFGCGKNGSVIDFVSQVFDLSFIDTCEKINADFNLCLPMNRRATMREKKAAIERFRQRRTDLKTEHNIEDDYWKAFDIWRLVDVLCTSNQPKTLDEPWSELFMIGLRWRSIAKFNLEEKTWAMLKH